MVQGRQSLQRGHLFKMEEGGILGAEQNTPSENGGSAPGNRPCGEFAVVPRTPPPPPPGLVLVYSRVKSLRYSFSHLERFMGFGIPVHGNGDIASGHPGEQDCSAIYCHAVSGKNHFSEALVNQSGSWDSGYWVMGGNILGHGI